MPSSKVSTLSTLPWAIRSSYSQFLNNGLKLGERKKFELAAFDIGNLYHSAIKDFFDTINTNNIKWADLDDKKSENIINDSIEKVMEQYENDALNDIARSAFIKKQVKDTSTETVNALVKHIRSGNFRNIWIINMKIQTCCRINILIRIIFLNVIHSVL